MPLPSALTRALDLAAAARSGGIPHTRRLLPLLLGARLEGVEAGAGRWSDSVLAMNGFPVEIAFTSSDPAFRCTVDPGLGDLAAVGRLWERLGAATIPDGLLATVASLQTAPLRFCAFVGLREDGAGVRFKLYFEVPDESAQEAERFATELIGRPRPLGNRPQRIEMIAYDPAGGRVEVYSRIEDMTTPELTALLWRADLMGRTADLREALAQCYPFPIDRDLPGSVFGYSHSVPVAGGGPIAFTLYTYARTMFGGDGRIRTALLGQAPRLEWDLGFYADLSAPLSMSEDVTTHHTMFGISLVGDRPAALHFGLAPPGEGA
ncbi:hypothetical protein [Azospirillum endophyticum]